VTFQGRTWPGVGVRIKGSASFQPIDEKPALKLEFDATVDGARLYGLERMTLNNEVWDPTMMAETMGYAAFRENGAPAPRTGYATVTLNERYLGLYAILETMDDQFVDRNWPGTHGDLWEMTRNCDFTGDCSCFEMQEPGDEGGDDAVTQGCAAAAAGTVSALQTAFDWEGLVSFLAVERAVNHPDSYSYNLNNFFVYHDRERLHLTPWGADSTFVYAYPPSADNPHCEPLYRNVLESSSVGWLGAFCEADETCRAELEARALDIADWMEDGLVDRMRQTRDQLEPYAELETYTNWTMDDRAQRVNCFLEWTTRRPTELRAWGGG